MNANASPAVFEFVSLLAAPATPKAPPAPAAAPVLAFRSVAAAKVAR